MLLRSCWSYNEGALRDFAPECFDRLKYCVDSLCVFGGEDQQPFGVFQNTEKYRFEQYEGGITSLYGYSEIRGLQCSVQGSEIWVQSLGPCACLIIHITETPTLCRPERGFFVFFPDYNKTEAQRMMAELKADRYSQYTNLMSFCWTLLSRSTGNHTFHLCTGGSTKGQALIPKHEEALTPDS